MAAASLTSLAVALGIGLLVGLERGWQARDEAEGQRTAGVRTYAITGLLGGVCGLMPVTPSAIFLGLSFAVAGLVLGAYHVMHARAQGEFSATGAVAGMATFGLGALATLGERDAAVAGAVGMTIMLATKRPLHAWVQRIHWEELRAALILLAMTFLLLPILPNRPVDPWLALNPAVIWELAIAMAAASFAGYVAIRILGEGAGLLVASVAGSLASSTATTANFARISREQPQAARRLGAGALLAGAVMFARLMIVVAILNPSLLAGVVPALATAMLASGGIAGFLLVREARAGSVSGNTRLVLSNPFELRTVLVLAALISVISVLAKILAEHGVGTWILIVAAVSGLADADPPTLSLSHLAGVSVTQGVAAAGIAIAAAANTLGKTVLAGRLGDRAMTRTLAIGNAIAIAGGGVAWLLWPAG